MTKMIRKPEVAFLGFSILMIASQTPSFAQGYGAYGSPQAYVGQQPYGAAQSYGAPQGYGGQPAYTQPGAVSAQTLSAPQWFSAYDQIRRQAQMTPAERRQADSLLAQGFSILMPGEQKVEAERLLNLLVQRYTRATQQIKQLPVIAQTQNLQQGYYQYFVTAQQLFSDYLKVENDLFAQTSSGTPLATELMNRKQGLEQLNSSIQGLDAQLRARLGIAPYHY